MTTNVQFGERPGLFGEHNFKYVVIAPAVFVILFIGLYPVLYSLIVSFQNVSVLNKDYSWAGLLNYTRLFEDTRLWESILHTAIITVISLPLELIFGLLLAMLFLTKPAMKTLPLAIIQYTGMYFNAMEEIFALMVMMSAPVIILFLILQKQFISGLTAGAVKG